MSDCATLETAAHEGWDSVILQARTLEWLAIFVLRDTFLLPQLNGSSNRVVTKEGVIPRE